VLIKKDISPFLVTSCLSPRRSPVPHPSEDSCSRTRLYTLFAGCRRSCAITRHRFLRTITLIGNFKKVAHRAFMSRGWSARHFPADVWPENDALLGIVTNWPRRKNFTNWLIKECFKALLLILSKVLMNTGCGICHVAKSDTFIFFTIKLHALILLTKLYKWQINAKESEEYNYENAQQNNFIESNNFWTFHGYLVNKSNHMCKITILQYNRN